MSLYPPVHMHSRTLAETIYLTFCLTVTVTVGGLLDISTEPDYERVRDVIREMYYFCFAKYLAAIYKRGEISRLHSGARLFNLGYE
jgi:hypothetical protein